MANNALLTATEFASTFLMLLKNSLVNGRLVSGTFNDQLTDENGLKLSIKRPPLFVAGTNEALDLHDVINGKVDIVIDTYKNVHVEYGDLESVQSVGDLVLNNTFQSAVSELAHVVDGAVAESYKEFADEVGTAGLVINSPQEFNVVHTRLMDMAVPNSQLNSAVQFADGEKIRGALIGTNIDDINRAALERIRIPILSEIDLFASNNLRSVTAGTRLEDTGPAVDGAGQNVDIRDVKDTNQQVLNIDGGGFDATYTRGDIFTIAGVFAVNPRSREVLPHLRQFTVLADAVADGAGLVALTISPPIIVGGTSDGVGPNPTKVNTAFQTASAIPADAAAIVFRNAPSLITPTRAAFHKSAIQLNSARLRDPFTGTSSFVSDPDTGLGIRYWRGSDIATGKHIHRWDTIFGVTNVRRDMGARVNGV